jgi:hypothetical protein
VKVNASNRPVRVNCVSVRFVMVVS